MSGFGKPCDRMSFWQLASKLDFVDGVCICVIDCMCMSFWQLVSVDGACMYVCLSFCQLASKLTLTIVDGVCTYVYDRVTHAGL